MTASFISNLIDWSKKNFYYLPWRSHRSFYNTLISEFMLQQTTVNAVVPKFDAFINKFSSWEELQSSEIDEVLHAWKGLGYYQRARRLYSLTKLFANEELFKSALLTPRIKIPGIGPYTRNALLSIGLNKPVLALDANIKRVLSRLLRTEDINAYDAFFQSLAEQFSPRDLNESFMDLGRVTCKALLTDCSNCLLRLMCMTNHHEPIASYQPRVSNKQIVHLLRAVVFDHHGRVLAYKKKQNSWLEGYFELPTFVMQPAGSLQNQYPQLPTDFYVPRNALQMKSSITKYQIVNHIVQVDRCHHELNESHFEYIAIDHPSLTMLSIKAIHKLQEVLS